MGILSVESFVEGQWVKGQGALETVCSAITGEIIAETGSEGLDFAAITRYGRDHGGAALRKMTFHERAGLVKALAQAILEKKEQLYGISFDTGATRSDSWIDIEGGAGSMLSMASKAKRELPNARLLIDGELEQLSKAGSFAGIHVFTPRQGVAVQINAYNFPIWGMLEKLAPALIAGVPCIVKPAQATGYVAEEAVRIMLSTGLLPVGALQLVSGSVGDLLDHLTGQDSVAFTGSSRTSQLLQTHPVVAREAVHFNAERDSLNASILGPDAEPGTPEFDLFVKEVAKEMTVKAGQKCTAIRRVLVPGKFMDDVQQALSRLLAAVVVGDPRREDVRMGALVSRAQRSDVVEKIISLSEEAKIVSSDPYGEAFQGEGLEHGAFLSPVLLRTDDPWKAAKIHDIEVFGPVATMMPYKDMADAVALANRGQGSLALSIATYDSRAAVDLAMGSGAFHGRIVIINRDCAKESTGHGSPLPVLVHGGPGRAGGGEELGGTRAMRHHMQRSAIQGTPAMLSAIVGQYLPGAPQTEGDIHPFRRRMSELDIGYTLKTGSRTITLDDIEQFAHFTGDTFYAHMDEVAAAASPIFGGRVAHGYLILSFAAGLFVDPAPGPVLANFGLEGLRFVKPVKPGDSIKVALTAKSKSVRTPDMGEVRWAVNVTNQDDDVVAAYDLLTMNML
jgi:oxepin-CoA hydrolase / 3-oxo-5,6-dehydrosuberyl-CoA semialdehyde dehydrogenase